ncbi:hypothetical protein N7471_010376 [Penicillium samsonianum]|uniref:uncharacterized protein n=1 Tax=Penicillium samsonianum TaxID=1882272 RepID=UPI0025476BDF|nr:uncharacterized protein N7471_010376 [Penicillium samsonianum]KAJ6125883.1 hypothetical protein N7471_010376 [Penicillium samsonianum]
MTELSKKSANDFVIISKILPLYCGPHVNINIESSKDEYTISKDLVCVESSYFSAIFEDQYLDSHQQTVIFKGEDGIVSKQNLEALIQWLYLRMVIFNIKNPEAQISGAIELVG